ncbi:DUF1345 domain-containing protein [Acinetobacter sp. EC24]|nr:DUF1345 domain-containing protein [Acinetobacter rathckeae]MBF7696685.1 DUF1345 domain-containing protein [Acinetobacter rathckeae]
MIYKKHTGLKNIFIFINSQSFNNTYIADVSLTSSRMRRFNTLHLLLAFAYNTLILAICINIAASLLS